MIRDLPTSPPPRTYRPLAIFGPTDPVCYGPWGERCQVVRADSTDPQVEELEPENVEAAFRHLMASFPEQVQGGDSK